MVEKFCDFQFRLLSLRTYFHLPNNGSSWTFFGQKFALDVNKVCMVCSTWALCPWLKRINYE